VPLKLIPPGKRKGNRHYVVRGRFLGRDVEVSTQKSSPKDAAQFKAELEIQLLAGHVPGSGARVTFHKACDLYKVTVGHREQQLVDRLKQGIADKYVGDVVQADIDTAARELYPTCTPETWNRQVYTPASSVLHYAAKNKWCGWLRVGRPKQKKPETRAATDDALEKLLGATTGKKQLLILWLFKHGSRISTALSVDCSRIYLGEREYEVYISKSRIWRRFPIDDEVYDLLKDDPDVLAGNGYLFPWRTRDGVGKWLRPLRERLGVTFTAHMARHWLGKKLRRHGLRTIMDALGQTDTQATIRYVASDIEAVREATKGLGRVLGRTKASD
jgi:integrase